MGKGGEAGQIQARLAESLFAKAVVFPGSHACCGQLTVHGWLCQISGPWADLPRNSSLVSIQLTWMLPNEHG